MGFGNNAENLKGGSRKGRPNKLRKGRAEAISKSGLTPLEYMLSVFRDTQVKQGLRMDAAKAAAPYIHPRLQAITYTDNSDVPMEVIKALLRVSRPELEELVLKALSGVQGLQSIAAPVPKREPVVIEHKANGSAPH